MERYTLKDTVFFNTVDKLMETWDSNDQSPIKGIHYIAKKYFNLQTGDSNLKSLLDSGYNLMIEIEITKVFSDSVKELISDKGDFLLIKRVYDTNLEKIKTVVNFKLNKSIIMYETNW